MGNADHRMLDAMLAQDRPEVDLALAAALPTADEATRRKIALALLERGHAGAQRHVVNLFFELPADLQHRLVEAADALFRPLREACREPAGRRPALEIIRRSGEPKLAYLVVDQLHDDDAEVREAAAACLIELARQAATDHKPGVRWTIAPADAHEFIDNVQRAVARMGPRSGGAALEAALWLLPRPMPRLRQTLEQPTHPATAAMRESLEGRGPASGETTARATLWALGLPTLAPAAWARLQQAAAGGRDAATVFDQRALLALPAVREAVRDRKRKLELTGEALRGDLPLDVAAGLLAVIDAQNLDAAARQALLARFASHGEPAIRLAAVRRLARVAHGTTAGHEATRQRLAALCNDPHEAVARTATIAWLGCEKSLGLRPLTTLVSNPHASVREMASRRLGPLGFERLWNAWPKLEPSCRLAAGEALIRIDRGFHRALGERLIAEDAATRLRALAIIAELAQGGFFEKTLLRLAGDDDTRVAAAAVRALSDVDSEAARHCREDAWSDARPEVRAQAIAAATRRAQAGTEETRLDELLRLARDDDAEPRARAIRGLLAMEAESAGEELERMLADDRPEHRIAALRLTEKLRMISMARDVAEMAVSDTVEAVRGRAWSVVGSMIAEMNAWRDPPPRPASPDPDGGEDSAAPSTDAPDAEAGDEPLAVLGSMMA